MPVAESLAGIISLIGQFRAERGADEQAGFNDFIEWLVRTNHEEIRNLLLLNAKATVGVKAILNQDREVMFEYLERIDQAVAAFSSNLQGFSELAAGIRPDQVLSVQAMSILSQFESSGASKALEMRTLSGVHFQFLDGNSRGFEITDPRFIEDDLRILVELRLLRHEFGSRGENIYLITRAASSLVRGGGS